MRNNPSVGIIGAFGFEKNVIGGQTVKNRVLLEYLKRRLGSERIFFADTSLWKRHPSSLLKSVKRTLKRSDSIIIALGNNGIRYLLPIILILNKSERKELEYLVIGGWLPTFLRHHRFLRKICGEFNHLFVETRDMKQRLELIGFGNVVYLPNFKDYSFIPGNKGEGKTFKTVFFSRVCREKGIELAIEAISKLNDDYDVELDIFGPLQSDYKDRFSNLVAGSSNVNYKGVLEPGSRKTYEILSSYDLMIFPTFHEGEGFPGAIIDAYISGLPVIASDWKYNSEIINEGKTGWLIQAKNSNALRGAIEKAVDNRELLEIMRSHCIEEAKKFNVNTVLPELLKAMGINV